MSTFSSSESGQDVVASDLSWIEAEELIFTEEPKCVTDEKHIQKITLGKLVLTIKSRESALEDIRNASTDSLVVTAEEENSDLVPAKYEGGLQVWECTYDLASLIAEREEEVKGKDVLDLGCGSALLGLVSLSLGASVTFQDYNKEVIEHWSRVNIMLSGLDPSKCHYWAGDWDSFADSCRSCFDIILTSETIYNAANYSKLCKVFQKLLKPRGYVYVAAKSYYFGLGGSLKLFQDTVSKESNFLITPVCKFSQGVQREIIKVSKKESSED